jgi:hypothetical protein
MKKKVDKAIEKRRKRNRKNFHASFKGQAAKSYLFRNLNEDTEFIEPNGHVLYRRITRKTLSESERIDRDERFAAYRDIQIRQRSKSPCDHWRPWRPELSPESQARREIHLAKLLDDFQS